VSAGQKNNNKFRTISLIPDLVTVQGRLLDCLRTAGNTSGVTIVLHRYRDSPRIGLRVISHQAALSLLESCVVDGLRVSDPETREDITFEMLRNRPRTQLRLWQAVIINGRMLHGPLSGIDLVIGQQTGAVEEVTFPCPAFADLWLDAHLAGQTLSVDSALLSRLATTRQPKQVDIVFTWVDDKDPTWQAKYKKHGANITTKDATDTARFANHDELLYALRGLFRYFDGIGHVFLVTDAQVPSFWGEFADRVTIVDHTQIMSDDVVRPTFNSHVIESCLHKIPNLAAQYLYLNDDVILTNATGVNDFFDDDGRAKVFLSGKTFIPDGTHTPDMLAADAAAINTRDLFQNRFSRSITRKFKHCPIALHRDVMVHLEAIFSDDFDAVRQNRFRNPNDLAVSGSLYQHYALMIDKANIADITYQYIEINSTKLPLRLLKLGVMSAWDRPVVMCLNAVTGGAGSRFNQWMVEWHMKRLCPAADTASRHGPRFERLHHRLLTMVAWGGRLLGK
jgi:hypothetical protein